MILKKLEIQGFKSFADRTEIVFSPGVIAVVGPNGSGKSNISDAILWVLGEQNVRALRGQKYQDVIFSGTDKRRPVGMAEVSLTVDNSSGRLPIDFSEVTVTRRAFRSGEGEFFINKSPCRLKDIYELFLDTGIGRDAYSIVSQGEVDAVLSARPEDRRALFDEAAGIKKYRHRKKEAEKKLETTQQNLLRVNDIIHELEAEIEPMAEQAEVAKRYLELMDRLQEIELGILVNDIHRFTADLAVTRDEKDRDTKAIRDADALLAALEEEKAALAVDLANADSQAERHQALHQEALTVAERLDSQLALTKQRYEAAEHAQVLLDEEITQLEQRVAQLEAQRNGMSLERLELDKEERELSARLEQKKAELSEIEAGIDRASRSADDQKSTYVELATRLAAQRNELANLSARVEDLSGLLDQRAVEIKETRDEASKAEAERASAEQRLEEARVRHETVARAMSEARSQLTEKQAVIAAAQQRQAELGRQLVEKQSRLKALQEMEEAREGYFQGVRSVMAAVKAGTLCGNFAVVADVIKVEKGFETAYEVALGSSVQDIITDTEREAKSAISFLKENQAGRATFLPLSMMRHTSSPMLRELLGEDGVLGLANELIQFDKKYAPAINALLSKVLVTDGIDSALRVSRSAIGWSKIVTLDGEIVFPSGAMTGGSAARKTSNLLGRKQEIETLATEISSLSSGALRAEENLRELNAEAETLSSRLESLEEEGTKCKMDLLECERSLEFASREARRLSQDLETLQVEYDDLKENLQRARNEQATLSREIKAADSENAKLDGAMAQTQGEVRALQDRYDQLGAEISALNVALASLTQKKLGMDHSLDNSDASARETTAEIYRKRHQLKSTLEEKAEAESLHARLVVERENASRQCAETLAQAEQWRKTKQAIMASSVDVAERIKEVNRNREAVTQRLHAAELREARLEIQLSQTSSRLLEDYNISPEEALRREKPPVKHGSAAEVMRLRREIRAMGEVNTGAVQEYSRLSERYEFLSSQRADLLSARDKLVEAIREIDQSTRGVFLETFQAVGEAFQKSFSRLFGGGRTELVLTDPDDILETGIDVMVEMPGKKRQNLLLLSGGERALTAAALIFALMSVRPSPFCVLDEVDAPLDEANVERFAEMVREFAEKSQMIVITHNRSTMEAADILYGVTMQEPGISRIVSVKLSEVATETV